MSVVLHVPHASAVIPDDVRAGSRLHRTCRNEKDVEMLDYSDLRDYLRDLRGDART